MSLMIAEQRRAGVVDLADVVALLGVERRLEGEVREADDGVHRRADLVAHVRQELALGLRGFLGLLLGQAQFRFQLLEIGDVLIDAIHVGRFSIGILHHVPHGMDPDKAPVDGTPVGEGRVIHRDRPVEGGGKFSSRAWRPPRRRPDIPAEMPRW